ncbi:family 16 glycosylhydrolase [Frankia sp. CiP1_Cm_nod1]|uniref:family 16 glycosylhydrolase n=2 Tax=unclassified Frankia TaxID=2632575 RepID=UPI002024A0D5
MPRLLSSAPIRSRFRTRRRLLAAALALPLGVALAACQAPRTSTSPESSAPPTSSIAQQAARAYLAARPSHDASAAPAGQPAQPSAPAEGPTQQAAPAQALVAPLVANPARPPLASAPASRPPGLDDSWRLVFGDEFNASVLDPAKWVTNVWQGAQCGANSGNHGSQNCYSPSAVTQSDGNAHLTASQTPYNFNGRIFPYTSGIINSDQQYFFTYGYVDVRARLPKGKGFWPAIWLYNPAYTLDEIDIMEFIGEDQTTIFQTLHTKHGGENQFKTRHADWSADYHNFAARWEPGALTFYIDGVQTGRLTNLVPSEKMYLMVNLDVGGPSSWGGAPNSATRFPSSVDIDYVHIYQQAP